MFFLSGTIGHNLKSLATFLILFLFIIVFVPPGLVGQTTESGRNLVKLSWIAGGEDNGQSQASSYDIRYSTEPAGTDTAGWWKTAKQAKNLPRPSLSGKKDSCFIENLSIDRNYYFAIKVADEAHNWSDIVKITELFNLSCADIDGNGSFNDLDLVYLLFYLYNDGPAPVTLSGGDVDNSGGINVADAIYIINFRFNSGPPPDCGD